jgi:cytochrome c oxidase assembly protein subunit 15
MVTVQFDHRLLAIVTAVLLLAYWLASRRHQLDKMTASSFTLVALLVVIQVTLGISTLLLHVPVWLGATHQAGALLLFTALLFNMHRLTRR